jgi:hypothetical protein
MWRRRSWLILYLQQTDYGSMPLRLWGCPCAGEARSSMPLAMHRGVWPLDAVPDVRTCW